MANLSEFGSSLETTRKWIDELMATLQTDEEKACRAFRVVGHVLRDQLTPSEVVDVSAQMPFLLRGIFIDGWKPAKNAVRLRSKEEFLEIVAQHLPDKPRSEKVEQMVREVFMFLDRRVSAGEIRHVINSLPKELRSLWPQYGGENTHGIRDTGTVTK